jgi:hypothetical protein
LHEAQEHEQWARDTHAAAVADVLSVFEEAAEVAAQRLAASEAAQRLRGSSASMDTQQLQQQLICKEKQLHSTRYRLQQAQHLDTLREGTILTQIIVPSSPTTNLRKSWGLWGLEKASVGQRRLLLSATSAALTLQQPNVLASRVVISLERVSCVTLGAPALLPDLPGVEVLAPWQVFVVACKQPSSTLCFMADSNSQLTACLLGLQHLLASQQPHNTPPPSRLASCCGCGYACASLLIAARWGYHHAKSSLLVC